MNRIDRLKKDYERELEKYCEKNSVNFISVQKLLEAERNKKLLKRNGLLQQHIDKEITNSIEDENRPNHST